MKVPEAILEEVRQQGFAVMEGFLGHDELRDAQRALSLHFPSHDEYFSDPQRFPSFRSGQFAGVEEFPYRSFELNRLAVHEDLVDAAERYLETAELHLYKIELWAKYAGAVDYAQPLHRDFGSHSLVVPRTDGRFGQLTTFIYLSDVTEADGPTTLVPYPYGRDVPFTPLYLEFGALADVEVQALGPAGSLLLYRTDILHRGSNFTAERRSRFSLLVDFQGAARRGAARWRGRRTDRTVGRNSYPHVRCASASLFGFPRPGDPYWNEQTLADVAKRYPGMDMTPYWANDT